MNKRANQRTKRNEPSTAEGAEPLVPERIARFLGSLPITAEPTEWMQGFCAAVKEFVGDVDTILVELSLTHNLQYSDDEIITRNANLLAREEARYVAMNVDRCGPDPQYLLQKARVMGYDIDSYYPVLQYRYLDPPSSGPTGEREYYGMIGLLRSKKKSPISERTIEFFVQLDPFLRFVFSGFCRKYRAAQPLVSSIARIVSPLVSGGSRSAKDFSVVLLRLYGFNHAQIAGMLHCSEYAVAKRLRHVYRSTGCASVFELYQRGLREFRMEERPEVGEDGVVTVY